MKKNQDEHNKNWAQVVAKAWIDPQFKKKLMASPESVLREYGFDTHKKYKIIEAHKNEICLVLPAKPEGNLSETELKNIAAASGKDCCWQSG